MNLAPQTAPTASKEQDGHDHDPDHDANNVPVLTEAANPTESSNAAYLTPPAPPLRTVVDGTDLGGGECYDLWSLLYPQEAGQQFGRSCAHKARIGMCSVVGQSCRRTCGLCRPPAAEAAAEHFVARLGGLVDGAARSSNTAGTGLRAVVALAPAHARLDHHVTGCCYRVANGFVASVRQHVPRDACESLLQEGEGKDGRSSGGGGRWIQYDPSHGVTERHCSAQDVEHTTSVAKLELPWEALKALEAMVSAVASSAAAGAAAGAASGTARGVLAAIDDADGPLFESDDEMDDDDDGGGDDDHESETNASQGVDGDTEMDDGMKSVRAKEAVEDAEDDVEDAAAMTKGLEHIAQLHEWHDSQANLYQQQQQQQQQQEQEQTNDFCYDLWSLQYPDEMVLMDSANARSCRAQAAAGRCTEEVIAALCRRTCGLCDGTEEQQEEDQQGTARLTEADEADEAREDLLAAAAAAVSEAEAEEAEEAAEAQAEQAVLEKQMRFGPDLANSRR